ncbi:hypothetical protein D3C84_351850 [compost metagenome]
MKIDRDFAGDGADVDQVPTAVEGFKGLSQALVRCPRAQGINDDIDTFAMGHFTDPLVSRDCTEGVNFNPARGRQVFHFLEQILVSGGAEDFTNAHSQRQGDGAQAECPADPVDQHGAAGTNVGLEQCFVGGAQITQSRGGFEADVVWQFDQAVLRGRNVLAKTTVGVVFEHARAFRCEPEIAVERIGGARNGVTRAACPA